MKGIKLENKTWQTAEKIFESIKTVVIPIGARLKEHGPHLPLNTDWIQAEYLTAKILEQCEVVVIPTIQYGFYPAFAEYPGSINITEEVFKNYLKDICSSLANQGVEHFYFLNTFKN